MEFYASCPEGFESALADELKRLGLSHVRRLKGRATFEGELEEGYRDLRKHQGVPPVVAPSEPRVCGARAL